MCPRYYSRSHFVVIISVNDIFRFTTNTLGILLSISMKLFFSLQTEDISEL